jgi:YidC/Oxa1 family membrane protein insertase
MYSFLGFIAKPLGVLLTHIYQFVGNYGLTLIFFTIIVRVCLFPLYANQTKHQMAMSEVQPKIKAIQKKYANDKARLQMEMQKLYKEENFNPAKGCLPMLIQMPIIMGLFALLRNPTMYLSGKIDYMIMAVHQNFFWIPDLSQPDLWALPILAAITTFITFSMTQQQTGQVDGAAAQMGGMMKMMKYIFPIMILWMGRSFPAGLTLYWFIGNLCTVGQYYILQKWKKRLLRLKAEGKGDFRKKKPAKPVDAGRIK